MVRYPLPRKGKLVCSVKIILYYEEISLRSESLHHDCYTVISQLPASSEVGIQPWTLHELVFVLYDVTWPEAEVEVESEFGE